VDGRRVVPRRPPGRPARARARIAAPALRTRRGPDIIVSVFLLTPRPDAAAPPGAARGAALARAACAVCGRRLGAGLGRCRNPLCASASRWFDWNLAIAERRGPLGARLDAYKYRGASLWAASFGRMLAGFLAERGLLEGFDLVLASPTFVGEGGRDRDHVGAILRAARDCLPEEHAHRLDVADPPAVVKTAPTPRLAGRAGPERRRIAEELIRPLLRVPDPGRTRRRRLLVVDDVFTDGRTLDEVARALRLQGGARQVCGVSLLRQPWRGGASGDGRRARPLPG
jgi:predicted amidophosphoribosyltransferase